MKLRTKIFNWLTGNEPRTTKKINNSYVAGKRTRLSSGWFGGTNINADIRNYQGNVNNTAEEAVKNDSLARGYIIRRQSNIVGHTGFTLQCKAAEPNGEPDELAQNIIENAFKEWSKKENCTVTGQLTFFQFQLLAISVFKKTGEIIVRFIEGKNVNKFGLSLQVISPEDLDTALNTTLNNGNDVVMGVEVNEWGRPIAYWFKKRNLWGRDSATSNESSHQRVQADEVVHVFKMEDPKQKRGISDYAPVLNGITNLADWKNAILTKAKNNEMNLGFIKKVDDEAAEYTGGNADSKQTIEDEDGEEKEIPVWDTDEGQYTFLPDGHDIVTTNDTFPGTIHESFDKSMKRDIATGLGESYNSLANDLEGVNFSSMRSGKLDEQSNYKIEQQILIDGLFTEIYLRFVKNAILFGAINLPYAKIDKFSMHKWQPRTYPWVDPYKDVQTAALEIQMGLKSRKQIISERYGRDINDVRKEIAKEREKDLSVGLNFIADKVEIKNVDTNEEKEIKEGKETKSIFKMKFGGIE